MNTHELLMMTSSELSNYKQTAITFHHIFLIKERQRKYLKQTDENVSSWNLFPSCSSVARGIY